MIVDAVMLAAGGSSRLAPDNKLLAIGADGRALIAHSLSGVLASGVRSVCVVVGFQADRVIAAIGGAPVCCVECPDAPRGMSASLRAGLGAIPDGGDAVLVCLGDMPLIGPGVIGKLTASWTRGRIVAPRFAGRRGNPVLWCRSFVAELSAITGDTGGRDLLTRHASATTWVDVDDQAVIADADTADALRRLPGGPWRSPGGGLI